MPRRTGGPTSATATATATAAPNHRARLAKFAKRKETLRNKARELVARCNVDVAVVCTGPGGVGDLDCWPSRAAVDAVVRRYNALEPTERVRYREDLAEQVAREVAAEREKLTRTREAGVAGAFGSYVGSLHGMSEEKKLRELLASIEAALVAARDRVLKLRAPPGGAADRATLSPGLVHDSEAAEEDSASATNNVVPPPRGEADAGGGGVGRPPSGKDPNPPNAVPVDAGEEEVVAENIVMGEDPGDEVQILQPPGDADADADDAGWMRSLVDDLKKPPQPQNAAGTEYINVGGFLMERDAYDFIRFDLGMPPPGVAPNYLDGGGDDEGEPLKLWSWDNTMPPPPK